MATTLRSDPTSRAGARQPSLLPASLRGPTITRCRELLDGEDWRARWWDELPWPEKRYLLEKVGASTECFAWRWARFDTAAQDAIIHAARAAARLFQCGRPRR